MAHWTVIRVFKGAVDSSGVTIGGSCLPHDQVAFASLVPDLFAQPLWPCRHCANQLSGRARIGMQPIAALLAIF